MGERILRERTREEGRYLFFGFEARGGRRGSTLGLWQSQGRRMMPLWWLLIRAFCRHPRPSGTSFLLHYERYRDREPCMLGGPRRTRLIGPKAQGWWSRVGGSPPTRLFISFVILAPPEAIWISYMTNSINKGCGVSKKNSQNQFIIKKTLTTNFFKFPKK